MNQSMKNLLKHHKTGTEFITKALEFDENSSSFNSFRI